jgi:hypothetical protein
MKNHYLFLFLFLFQQSLLAQSVQWFAPGAHWEYDYYDYSNVNHQGKRTLFVDGTEVIDGKVCTKLSGTETLISPQNTVILHYLQPFFCYTENDTVFIKYSNSNYVLYDFTRQVGDTIRNIFPYNFGVLEETGDTLLWGSVSTRYQKWAKKMINLPDDIAYVYEGIGGDNFDFWFYSSINGLTELYQKITCYRDDFYSQPSCNFINAPQYAKFPTEEASWSEEETIWCSYIGKQYFQKGDTTIAGIGTGKKIYKRINYSGSAPCPNASANNFNNPYEFIGIIQQDFFEKKVWFTLLNTDAGANPSGGEIEINQKTLLYDYDIDPGDELTWMPEYSSKIFAYNDSIFLASGQWRKTYFFLNDMLEVDTNNFWIEGIGGNKGLFSSRLPQTADVDNILNCHYGLSGNTYQSYYRGDSTSCNTTPTIGTNETLLSQNIRLSPNPVTDFFTLDLPSEILPANLTITDILGRRINYFSQTETSQRFDFQGDRIKSGLYFLEIKGKNGVNITRKFVH